MAVNINEGGFLYLTDGANTMRVPFQRAVIGITDAIQRQRYAGDAGYKFSLGKISREVRVTRVFLTTHANARDFVKQLLDWNQAGPYELVIYRNSTPDKSYLFGNGDDHLHVLCPDIGDIEKIAPGNRQLFAVGRLVFVD